MTTGPAQRPWRFDFAVAPEERVPRHVQLARALVREIQRGRLSPGQMLPGTRTLAANLKLNRKVVVAAIEELVCPRGEEGILFMPPVTKGRRRSPSETCGAW